MHHLRAFWNYASVIAQTKTILGVELTNKICDELPYTPAIAFYTWKSESDHTIHVCFPSPNTGPNAKSDPHPVLNNSVPIDTHGTSECEKKLCCNAIQYCF